MRPIKKPAPDEQTVLNGLQARLLSGSKDLRRVHALLDKHHYLKAVKPVGERLYYALCDAAGKWLGVLVFQAAAKHLRPREEWVGWTSEQRRRRLALVVNNSRFLLLPGRTFPNLGSKGLRLVLERLSQDWSERYGHPVLVVETFVDPEQFCGTVYTANGWEELGQTDGCGRKRREYYVRHDKPKRLFVRPLRRNARRSLRAERLTPELAVVEEKVPPRSQQSPQELRSLVGYFKQIPDYRGRIGAYPLWSLLAMVACAFLCGPRRGSKDLAGFAQGFSQSQLHALGVRRDKRKRYPAPSQPTFWRLLARVDLAEVENCLRAFQNQVRGKPDPGELVVVDGKQPRHGGGHSVLNAFAAPSERFLGALGVDVKTNEIPVAQELLPQLDLEGRLAGLDALHGQTETARVIVQECGADYTLTIKGNQPTVQASIAQLFAAAEAASPPLGRPSAPPPPPRPTRAGPKSARLRSSASPASRSPSPGPPKPRA